MARSVAKGVHAARPPFGLRANRVIENGRVRVSWEVEPEEAGAIKEMLRLAVDLNLGFKAIADRLNETGYKSRTGVPFASSTVHRVLTNPALVGTLRHGQRARKGNPKREATEVTGFFPQFCHKMSGSAFSSD
jgi:hypothetical protein